MTKKAKKTENSNASEREEETVKSHEKIEMEKVEQELPEVTTDSTKENMVEESENFENTIPDEAPEKKKNVGLIILDILKKILLIVTSPIWFPWKFLFIKKKGNKFGDISGDKKIFRIVRAPITKTIKFIAYVCIICIEILVLYKIRYSVLTYPLTKNSVQNYYLSENVSSTPEYRESLTQAFKHIDEWDLDTKNKMYVIFDSDIIKNTFRYASDDTKQYIVDKFNNDDEFREDIEYTAKTIDELLARAMKEIPDSLGSEEVTSILAPITSVGATAIDYRVALDALGTISDLLLTDESIAEGSLDLKPEEIDQSIEMITKYAHGMSLEEAYYSQSETTENLE